MVVFQQMMILLAVMLVGFYLARKGIFTEDFSQKVSWIIVNVANPALIISGSTDLDSGMEAKEVVYILVLSFALYGILILVGELLPGILRIKKDHQGIYKIMFVFTNNGFLGFPLISAVYGKSALVAAALFAVPFDVLIYTYGIMVISQKEDSKFELKKMLNIGLAACVITILIAIFKVPIPNAPSQFINMIANLTSPLSMMVIGASMVNVHFKELVTDRERLVFSLVKMIIFPVIAGFVIKALVPNTIYQGIMLIFVAAPAASMSAMLAQQYHGDYEGASKGLLFTTFISVLTIPLVFMITGI